MSQQRSSNAVGLDHDNHPDAYLCIGANERRAMNPARLRRRWGAGTAGRSTRGATAVGFGEEVSAETTVTFRTCGAFFGSGCGCG